jgi:hypothetical protein
MCQLVFKVIYYFTKQQNTKKEVCTTTDHFKKIKEKNKKQIQHYFVFQVNYKVYFFKCQVKSYYFNTIFYSGKSSKKSSFKKI